MLHPKPRDGSPWYIVAISLFPLSPTRGAEAGSPPPGRPYPLGVMSPVFRACSPTRAPYPTDLKSDRMTCIKSSQLDLK